VGQLGKEVITYVVSSEVNSMHHKPKKSLGQHFLTNLGVVKKIIDAGDIHADDLVLEIGPGKGVLTQKLLVLTRKVVAVEKDDALHELLKTSFAGAIASGRLDLIHADILHWNIPSYNLQATTYKLVANIPYNITGAILQKFLSSATPPEMMVFLVQKEVAERIVARDHKESLLSISVKVYGTPHLIARVGAGSFFPKPNVDSALLKIDGISKVFFADGISEGAFFDFLRAGFAHKRKLLANNIKGYFRTTKSLEQALASAHISSKSRAEELAPQSWKHLFRLAQDEPVQ
jgi:16S rRNA (adenine1518-N6/adenine1519-N6)-dimethyltransferase